MCLVTNQIQLRHIKYHALDKAIVISAKFLNPAHFLVPQSGSGAVYGESHKHGLTEWY